MESPAAPALHPGDLAALLQHLLSAQSAEVRESFARPVQGLVLSAGAAPTHGGHVTAQGDPVPGQPTVAHQPVSPAPTMQPQYVAQPTVQPPLPPHPPPVAAQQFAYSMPVGQSGYSSQHSAPYPEYAVSSQQQFAPPPQREATPPPALPSYPTSTPAPPLYAAPPSVPPLYAAAPPAPPAPPATPAPPSFPLYAAPVPLPLNYSYPTPVPPVSACDAYPCLRSRVPVPR